MGTDQPVVEKPSLARRLFAGGESGLAPVGLAVALVFLGTVAAATWQTSQAQRTLLQEAHAGKIQALGELLARTSEALLSADETSALRRVIGEAGVSYNLDACSLTLPNGQIVADADPSRINLPKLPASWPGQAGPAKDTAADGAISLSYPLEVPRRGSATLEISAKLGPSTRTGVTIQAGIGIITAAALGTLLLLYRYSRRRFRGISMIRQALLAKQEGEGGRAALEISPKFGPEAGAWNNLLSEREDLRKQVVLGQAHNSLRSQNDRGEDLSAACDAMPQGLVLVDESMQAKYANGAASVFLRVKRDEIIDSNISEWISDEKVLEAAQRSASRPTHERTIVEVARDESEGGGVLRFIVRPVRREDTGAAMIIIEDITQQRVAEKARNAFLAQATHELRTPLTNIRLYVETALDEGREDHAMTAKCLNVINDESRRLERVVGDVLSVSEIEAGSFSVKRDDVRLDTLFEQLAADYEAQAADKKIDLTFDLPPKLPTLQADRDKVSLALHNLIGNALKYTPEGGKVTINVTVSSSQVTVDVTDTGIGMSEEDAQRIFEKFYRAKDRRVSEITGSGLGLALAREVIRLHGGDITVQSELDKGSTFTLVVPMVGAPA